MPRSSRGMPNFPLRQSSARDLAWSRKRYSDVSHSGRCDRGKCQLRFIAPVADGYGVDHIGWRHVRNESRSTTSAREPPEFGAKGPVLQLCERF
jgi:hypothetical protein